MPILDRTGPQGMGPMTGRGMGNCRAGVRGYGRGMGYGQGLGMGPRAQMGYCPYVPQITKNEEIEYLGEDASMLEKMLKDVKARLSSLKKGQK